MRLQADVMTKSLVCFHMIFHLTKVVLIFSWKRLELADTCIFHAGAFRDYWARDLGRYGWKG